MTENEFINLVKTEYPDLIGLLRAKGYSTDEAEDAIQTMSLELLQNLDGLDLGQNPSAFIKRRAVWEANMQRVASHDYQHAPLVDYDRHVVSNVETEHDIHHAIEKLTPEMMTIAEMVYSGYTFTEIAHILGESYYYVYSVWLDAKERLRDFLKGYEPQATQFDKVNDNEFTDE